MATGTSLLADNETAGLRAHADGRYGADALELGWQVAAYGLDGERRVIAAEPLDGDVWWRFLAWAETQRLVGLLEDAIAAGDLAVTPEQGAEAADAHLRWMTTVLRLERMLLDVAEELRRGGVSFRVLKGPAFARTAYPDPALRPFCDIDLLIAGDHFDTTKALLADLGCARIHAEPRPGFDRRFGKGASYRTPTGFELDLHRTLVQGPFGLRIKTDELFEEADQIEVGGRALPILPAHIRFLNACYHAAVSDVPPKVLPIRDVAQLYAATSPSDLDRAMSTAQRWGGDAVVARAVRFASALSPSLDAGVGSWARAHQPSPAQRRALGLYTETPGYLRLAVGGFEAVSGLRAKASYAAALLFPSRAYLRRRDRSYIRRLLRASKGAASHRAPR